jgi:hypothetical protein
MSLLDSLVVGKNFDSYDDVLEFADALAKENNFPLKINDTVSIEAYNAKVKNQIDPKWKFKFVFITCSHYGRHKTRATGLRPNQCVYAANCKFGFRAVFIPVLGKFQIAPEKFCKAHANHAISENHIKLYRRKE